MNDLTDHLTLTAAWQPLQLFVAIAAGAFAATTLSDIVRPDWRRLYEAVHVAMNSLLIAGCGLVLHNGVLVAPLAGGDGGLAAAFNAVAVSALTCAIGILGILVALGNWNRPRIFRNDPHPCTAMVLS